MNKLIKSIPVSLVVVFLTFSCKEKEAEIISVDKVPKIEVDVKNNIPDSVISKSIFIHETPDGLTRVWVDSKDRKSNYFYSDTVNIFNIGRYRFENKELKKTKHLELYRNEWSYLQIDSASLKKEIIDQDEFLFLTLLPSTMGRAIPGETVFFYLLNLNNIDDHHSLSYSGYYDQYCNDCIKGEFSPAETFPKNKKAWQQFRKYAEKSKFISQAKGDEKKLAYYKNYEQKWETDNQTDNHYGAGFGGVPDQLYSTYYKEDLLEINGHRVDESIENDRYIIGTFFRGNLVGFDKKKNRYFPLIVESCAHSCNKALSFVDGKTLRITYEAGEEFDIDLDQIIFKN